MSEWEENHFPQENFVQSQKGMSNYFRFSVTHSTLWIKRRTFCPEIIIIKRNCEYHKRGLTMSEWGGGGERERAKRLIYDNQVDYMQILFSQAR